MGSNFGTGYIRLDLGGRYSVERFEIYNTADDRIKDYNVYVTDSSVASTTIQPSWGAYVATGTFPAVDGIQNVDLAPNEGRYLILFIKTHEWHVHPKEAWIYGRPAIGVPSFSVVGSTSASSIFTRSTTVNVTCLGQVARMPRPTVWNLTQTSRNQTGCFTQQLIADL